MFLIKFTLLLKWKKYMQQCVQWQSINAKNTP